MQLQKAEQLAHELMDEFGLTEWSFKFDKAKRRFGCCKLRRKLISLSRQLVKLNDREPVEDTIRHEIAHALDYEDRGKSDHSYHWKAWARKVGAEPTRCYRRDEVNNQFAYYDYCPNCGHKSGRHRRQPKNAKMASCTNCSPRFSMDYLVVFNIPAEVMGKIERGETRWQDLQQTKAVARKASLRYPIEFEESDFYRQIKEKPAKQPKIAAKDKAKSKPKKRGVIATIAHAITEAGRDGITKDEILQILVKEFPNRDADSMSNTINTQVPYRINKERFELEKIDGKYRKK